jgi:hypothetical protein
MNINKFKDFLKKLDESFENSKPIKLNKKDNLYSENFIIENKKYSITIEKLENIKEFNFYSFKFCLIEDDFKLYHNVKNKDIKVSLTVLGTISKTLEKFIDDIKPDVLFFITSDNNRGRKLLYSRFSKEYSEKSKYEYIEW